MRSHDDASRLIGRQLEQLESWAIPDVLTRHLSAAHYLALPDEHSTTTSKSETFNSNNELWEEFIHTRRLGIGSRLTLQSFFIFEWIPRSPGLYFTPFGRQARLEAEHRVRRLEDGVIVFDPYGKMSMLDGGIGNLRLKPIVVNGQDLVLMSGSSNGECHEGFPLAVPTELYDSIADQVRHRGAVVRTLSGRLRAVPQELDFLYDSYRNVRKLYLLVDDISVPTLRKSRTLEDLNVSVAASFMSNYEGSPKMYACYVNTDPRIQDSLRDRVRWMEEVYVKKEYQGRVVTDFDELENHFDGAIFGLKKVMALGVRREDFLSVDPFLLPGTVYVDQLIMQQTIIKEQRMSQYNVVGPVGALGDNARAENFIQVAGSDMERLTTELAALKQAAIGRAQSAEQQQAVIAISEAEEAAKAGNPAGMLQKLKAAGKWAADVASSIGKDVLAKIIEHQVGMG